MRPIKKRNKGRQVWMDAPPYLNSNESVANQVTVRSELRFLRLEASSPALRDTETYFPVRGPD